MRCRALVLAALAAGCVEVPGPAPVVCDTGEDGDGDGWACDARLPDCDDGDAAIHPGADEVPGDGLDQDCLGGDASPSDLLPGVEIDDPDTSPSVRMPGAYVGFPTTGARYPDELIVESLGQDILASMGIAIDPLFRTGDVADAPRLEVTATGPALGMAYLSWAEDVGGASVEGSTHLWFFPDGRIVRNDRIDLLEAITGTDLDLSTYVSFAAGPFTHLRWPELVGGVPIDGDVETELWSGGPEMDGWLCLYDQVGGAMAGFGWLTDGFGGGPRAWSGLGAVSLGWDFERDAAQIGPGNYYLASVTFVGAAGAGPRCQLTEKEIGLLDGDVLEATEGTLGNELDGGIAGRFIFSVGSNLP
jgi:hypothetical protein